MAPEGHMCAWAPLSSRCQREAKKNIMGTTSSVSLRRARKLWRNAPRRPRTVAPLPRWRTARDRPVLGDAGYCATPLTGLGTSLALVGAAPAGEPDPSAPAGRRLGRPPPLQE